MQFEVSLDDGTKHTVSVKPSDLVSFERKYDIAYSSLFVVKVDPETGLVVRDAQGEPDSEPGPAFRVEHTFYLAWNASRRAGLLGDNPPEFDAWLDTVDDVDPIEEAPLAS